MQLESRARFMEQLRAANGQRAKLRESQELRGEIRQAELRAESSWSKATGQVRQNGSVLVLIIARGILLDFWQDSENEKLMQRMSNDRSTRRADLPED